MMMTVSVMGKTHWGSSFILFLFNICSLTLALSVNLTKSSYYYGGLKVLSCFSHFFYINYLGFFHMEYLSISSFIHLLNHLFVLVCHRCLYYLCYNPIFSLFRSSVGLWKLVYFCQASILFTYFFDHFFNFWKLKMLRHHLVFPEP